MGFAIFIAVLQMAYIRKKKIIIINNKNHKNSTKVIRSKI